MSKKHSSQLVAPDCPLGVMDLLMVKQIRRGMLENAYTPVVVHSPWSLACADGSARGKAPIGANWQDGHPRWKLMTKDLNWLKAGANTGLLLGKDPFPIQALDLDIEDEEAMRLIFKTIRPPMPKGVLVRYRDNTVRMAILMRCKPGVTKQKIQGERGAVERLALGQQIVVHGTHPTGAPLEWLNDKAPWNVHAQDLPLVTEHEITAIFDAIIKSGALGGKVDRTKASSGSNGGPGPGQDIAARFRELVTKHGGVVQAVASFFREVGERGTYRHDSLISVAGHLIARDWPKKQAAILLTKHADKWFGEGSWAAEVDAALKHALTRKRNQQK